MGSASVDVSPVRSPPLATFGRRVVGLALSRPVVTVFVVALVVRVAVAIGVAIFSDGILFSDDSLYFGLASDQAGGHIADWTAHDHYLYTHTGTLLWPI